MEHPQGGTQGCHSNIGPTLNGSQDVPSVCALSKPHSRVPLDSKSSSPFPRKSSERIDVGKHKMLRYPRKDLRARSAVSWVEDTNGARVLEQRGSNRSTGACKIQSEGTKHSWALMLQLKAHGIFHRKYCAAKVRKINRLDAKGVQHLAGCAPTKNSRMQFSINDLLMHFQAWFRMQ